MPPIRGLPMRNVPALSLCAGVVISCLVLAPFKVALSQTVPPRIPPSLEFLDSFDSAGARVAVDPKPLVSKPLTPKRRFFRMPSSELFDLLEPNYFITGGNFSDNAGSKPFAQADNQVKFRVAIRYRVLGAPPGLLNKLFGGQRDDTYDSGFHFGYRQNSMWNLYSESAPFLDNNYNPHGFLYLDGFDVFGPGLASNTDYRWYHPSFKLGFHHESNGRDGANSRSWNRLIGGLDLGDSKQTKVYGSVSFWSVVGDLKDNPHIQDFSGRGELQLYWQPLLDDPRPLDLSVFGTSLITRIAGKRGFVNVEASVYVNPFVLRKSRSDTTFSVSDYSWAPTLMAQAFCGTGQYLLHMERSECSIRAGFAFIR
jgi:hypothetical protein